jgi:hypothetical protein
MESDSGLARAGKAGALTHWRAHFGEKTERGEKDGVPLEITLSGCMRWKIRVGARVGNTFLERRYLVV